MSRLSLTVPRWIDVLAEFNMWFGGRFTVPNPFPSPFRQENPMTTASDTLAIYAIDPAHSSIEFVVRHIMIAKVRGRFPNFSGTVTALENTGIPTQFAVEIDVASLDTQEEERDAQLRSAEFFDPERYPKMSFTSTSITSSGSSFTATGNLSIRGVTKSIALSGSFEGHGKDAWGKDRTAYSAKTKVNRKDFGMTWNLALESGGFLIGDEIAIEVEVEAVRQP
jgi:polyisoprenoid-binding protein YceI